MAKKAALGELQRLVTQGDLGWHEIDAVCDRMQLGPLVKSSVMVELMSWRSTQQSTMEQAVSATNSLAHLMPERSDLGASYGSKNNNQSKVLSASGIKYENSGNSIGNTSFASPARGPGVPLALAGADTGYARSLDSLSSQISSMDDLLIRAKREKVVTQNDSLLASIDGQRRDDAGLSLRAYMGLETASDGMSTLSAASPTVTLASPLSGSIPASAASPGLGLSASMLLPTAPQATPSSASATKEWGATGSAGGLTSKATASAAGGTGGGFSKASPGRMVALSSAKSGATPNSARPMPSQSPLTAVSEEIESRLAAIVGVLKPERTGAVGGVGARSGAGYAAATPPSNPRVEAASPPRGDANTGMGEAYSPGRAVSARSASDAFADSPARGLNMEVARTFGKSAVGSAIMFSQDSVNRRRNLATALENNLAGVSSTSHPSMETLVSCGAGLGVFSAIGGSGSPGAGSRMAGDSVHRSAMHLRPLQSAPSSTPATDPAPGLRPPSSQLFDGVAWTDMSGSKFAFSSQSYAVLAQAAAEMASSPTRRQGGAASLSASSRTLVHSQGEGQGSAWLEEEEGDALPLTMSLSRICAAATSAAAAAVAACAAALSPESMMLATRGVAGDGGRADTVPAPDAAPVALPAALPTYESLGKEELKAECTKRGLPSDGKREDMRARLRAADEAATNAAAPVSTAMEGKREAEEVKGEKSEKKAKKLKEAKAVAEQAAIISADAAPVLVAATMPSADPFESMGKDELKAECSKRGLSGEGKREEMRARLRADDASKASPAAAGPASTPVPAGADLYESLGKEELKAECIRRGLSADGKRDDMRARLKLTDEATKAVVPPSLSAATPTATSAVTTDVYESLGKEELKAECTKRGLPSDGKREDMRARLRAVDEAATTIALPSPAPAALVVVVSDPVLLPVAEWAQEKDATGKVTFFNAGTGQRRLFPPPGFKK